MYSKIQQIMIMTTLKFLFKYINHFTFSQIKISPDRFHLRAMYKEARTEGRCVGPGWHNQQVFKLDWEARLRPHGICTLSVSHLLVNLSASGGFLAHQSLGVMSSTFLSSLHICILRTNVLDGIAVVILGGGIFTWALCTRSLPKRYAP